MSNHIEHLHHHYRVLGDRATASRLTLRLDQLARMRLAMALDDALSRAFGTTKAIHFVREVEAKFALNSGRQLLDSQLVTQWAQQITQAIVRTVRQGEWGNEANYKGFTDQASYVVAFIVDLLAGRAWEQWYYQNWHHLHGLEQSEVIQEVLLENRAEFGEILTKLHVQGVLERVLGLLGDVGSERVWLADGQAAETVTAVSLRPLIAQVHHLVTVLGWWRTAVPEVEALLADYLATNPTTADWRDQAGLTTAVIAILHFLFRQEALAVPTDFGLKLEQQLEAFDWLDTEGLKKALNGLAAQAMEQAEHQHEIGLMAFGGFAEGRPSQDIGSQRIGDDSRSHFETEARHNPKAGYRALVAPSDRLLEDLATAVRHISSRLEPTAPQNSQRLFAALVEVAPEWQTDERFVMITIRLLLRLWQGAAQGVELTRFLASVKQQLVSNAERVAIYETAAVLPERAQATDAASHKRGESRGEMGAEGETVPRAAAQVTSNQQLATGSLPIIRDSALSAEMPLAIPSERDLLRDLETAVYHLVDPTGKMPVLPSDPADPQNGQLLYAALLAVSPTWENDAVALATIEMLLSVWQAVGKGVRLDKLFGSRLAVVSVPNVGALPVQTSGSGITLRWQWLLQDLETAVRQTATSLDASKPASVQNQLRLYAALLAHAPVWQDDPLIATTIPTLLAAWQSVAYCAEPDRLLAALAKQDEQAIGAILFPEEEMADWQTPVGQALTQLLRWEAQGLALLRSVVFAGTAHQSGNNMMESSASPLADELIEGKAIQQNRVTEDANSNADTISAACAPTDRGVCFTKLASTLPVVQFIRRANGQMDKNEATQRQAAESSRRYRLGEEVPTEAAGAFLLLRGVLDARLPWLVKETNFSPQDRWPLVAPLLLSLGLRWSGTAVSAAGELDAGLGVLAGLDAVPTLSTLKAAWAQNDASRQAKFQKALLQTLAGQRVVGGSKLYLHEVGLANGQTAVVAGAGDSQIWPLGQIVVADENLASLVGAWQTTWETAMGQPPTLVVEDGLASRLSAAQQQQREAPDEDDVYANSALTLATMQQAFDKSQLGLPDVDLTTCLTAHAVVRLWARWLRQFAASSTPYLLNNLVRRSGTVRLEARRVVVTLKKRPLDIVVEMAGYFEPLERVPWLDGRDLHFIVEK